MQPKFQKTVTEAANRSFKLPEQSHGTMSNAHTTSAGTSHVKTKPATVLNYKIRFDICAELNGWIMVQKGLPLYFAVSLR